MMSYEDVKPQDTTCGVGREYKKIVEIIIDRCRAVLFKHDKFIEEGMRSRCVEDLAKLKRCLLQVGVVRSPGMTRSFSQALLFGPTASPVRGGRSSSVPRGSPPDRFPTLGGSSTPEEGLHGHSPVPLEEKNDEFQFLIWMFDTGLFAIDDALDKCATFFIKNIFFFIWNKVMIPKALDLALITYDRVRVRWRVSPMEGSKQNKLAKEFIKEVVTGCEWLANVSLSSNICVNLSLGLDMDESNLGSLYFQAVDKVRPNLRFDWHRLIDMDRQRYGEDGRLQLMDKEYPWCQDFRVRTEHLGIVSVEFFSIDLEDLSRARGQDPIHIKTFESIGKDIVHAIQIAAGFVTEMDLREKVVNAYFNGSGVLVFAIAEGSIPVGVSSGGVEAHDMYPRCVYVQDVYQAQRLGNTLIFLMIDYMFKHQFNSPSDVIDMVTRSANPVVVAKYPFGLRKAAAVFELAKAFKRVVPFQSDSHQSKPNRCMMRQLQLLMPDLSGDRAQRAIDAYYQMLASITGDFNKNLEQQQIIYTFFISLISGYYWTKEGTDPKAVYDNFEDDFKIIFHNRADGISFDAHIIDIKYCLNRIFEETGACYHQPESKLTLSVYRVLALLDVMWRYCDDNHISEVRTTAQAQHILHHFGHLLGTTWTHGEPGEQRAADIGRHVYINLEALALVDLEEFKRLLNHLFSVGKDIFPQGRPVCYGFGYDYIRTRGISMASLAITNGLNIRFKLSAFLSRFLGNDSLMAQILAVKMAPLFKKSCLRNGPFDPHGGVNSELSKIATGAYVILRAPLPRSPRLGKLDSDFRRFLAFYKPPQQQLDDSRGCVRMERVVYGIICILRAFVEKSQSTPHDLAGIYQSGTFKTIEDGVKELNRSFVPVPTYFQWMCASARAVGVRVCRFAGCSRRGAYVSLPSDDTPVKRVSGGEKFREQLFSFSGKQLRLQRVYLPPEKGSGHTDMDGMKGSQGPHHDKRPRYNGAVTEKTRWVTDALFVLWCSSKYEKITREGSMEEGVMEEELMKSLTEFFPKTKISPEDALQLFDDYGKIIQSLKTMFSTSYKTYTDSKKLLNMETSWTDFKCQFFDEVCEEDSPAKPPLMFEWANRLWRPEECGGLYLIQSMARKIMDPTVQRHGIGIVQCNSAGEHKLTEYWSEDRDTQSRTKAKFLLYGKGEGTDFVYQVLYNAPVSHIFNPDMAFMPWLTDVVGAFMKTKPVLYSLEGDVQRGVSRYFRLLTQEQYLNKRIEFIKMLQKVCEELPDLQKSLCQDYDGDEGRLGTAFNTAFKFFCDAIDPELQRLLKRIFIRYIESCGDKIN